MGLARSEQADDVLVVLRNGGDEQQRHVLPQQNRGRQCREIDQSAFEVSINDKPLFSTEKQVLILIRKLEIFESKRKKFRRF